MWKLSSTVPASTTYAMTLMVGASTLCLPPLPFPVHVPQGFERFSMSSVNGCPAPITPDEVARIILGNVSDEFERLRGVPGFQLEPVPWKTVKHLVAENTTDSLGKLGRSPAGQVIYWSFKTKADREWASIADYMLSEVFQFPIHPTADGRKAVSVPAPDWQNPTIVWRPNDFPYNFEADVEHHNIWSTIPLTEERVLEIASRHREGYEYVWFTNPLPLASIPSVWHSHIISRPLQNGQKGPGVHVGISKGL